MVVSGWDANAIRNADLGAVDTAAEPRPDLLVSRAIDEDGAADV